MINLNDCVISVGEKAHNFLAVDNDVKNGKYRGNLDNFYFLENGRTTCNPTLL